MRYSLISEDEKAFHLTHPDGDTFQVAKKGLKPDMVAHIQKLKPKKMSEGGTVFGDEEVEDPTFGITPNTNVLEDIFSAQSTPAPDSMSPNQGKRLDPEKYGLRGVPVLGDMIKTFGESEEHKLKRQLGFMSPDSPDYKKTEERLGALTSNPQIPESAVPLPSGQATPVSLDSSEGMPELTQNTVDLETNQQPLFQAPTTRTPSASDPFALQESGIRGSARVQGDLGSAQATAIGKRQDQLEDQYRDFKTAIGEINKDTETKLADYASGKVDPNRVINNMDSGNKIMAGIGMILGGFGAGLTGGPNQALETLNKTIDKDIESQKIDLDKKKNLLSINFAKSKNLEQAYLMSKNDTLTALEADVKRLAAAASGPMAKEREKMLIGAIQAQRLATTASLAGMIAKNATPGQKAADQDFGTEYNKWTSGGQSKVDKNLDKLEGVLKTLEERKKDWVGTSGRVTGRLWDVFRSEESVGIRDDITAAIVDTVKETFPGAISDKETELILKKAYNETLSPEQNIPRVRATLVQLQRARQDKENKVKHFEKYGTLIGYSGGSERQETRVQVVAPNGQVGSIPISQLKSAKSKGFKEAR